jgi:hypothetical protein
VVARSRFRLLTALGFGLVVLTSIGCGLGSAGPVVAKPASAAQQPAQSAAKPAAAAANTTPYKPVDACTLVTVAEIEAVVGKLSGEPFALAGPEGLFRMCSFHTESSKPVLVTVARAETWAGRKGAARANKDTEQVSGVGDEAFLTSDLEGGYNLQVRKGPAVLQINVPLGHDQALDATKTIAAKALPRL